MNTDRILDLGDEFFRLARDRVPLEFMRTDLTMPQLKVLYTLYIDGPQTCGALASAQELSLPTMTGILTRLEKRGYLARHRDDEDSRRVISNLSRRGRELVDRLWASGREGLATLLADVPNDDLQTIERALEILIQALTRTPAPPPDTWVPSRTDA
jgi:DNA-binding MarR family transcriptional regulator